MVFSMKMNWSNSKGNTAMAADSTSSSTPAPPATTMIDPMSPVAVWYMENPATARNTADCLGTSKQKCTSATHTKVMKMKSTICVVKDHSPIRRGSHTNPM